MLSHSESGHAVPFLRRTSAVPVNLFVASTTHGPRWSESTSFKPICVVANGEISFMAEYYTIVYMYHFFFIYLFLDGHVHVRVEDK